MTCGIYQITCWINGKIYIGSAVNIEKRWRVHRSDLKLKKHGSITLQRAWYKYGKENFTFHVLELVEDKTKLIEREQHWFDLLKPFDPTIGYNINPVAGSRLGTKENPEMTAKRAAKLRGRKQSPEEIAKRAASNTGKKRTEETKARMSAWQKGSVRPNFHSEESKLKIGEGSKITRAKEREKKYKEIDKIIATSVVVVVNSKDFNNNGGWPK